MRERYRAFKLGLEVKRKLEEVFGIMKKEKEDFIEAALGGRMVEKLDGTIKCVRWGDCQFGQIPCLRLWWVRSSEEAKLGEVLKTVLEVFASSNLESNKPILEKLESFQLKLTELVENGERAPGMKNLANGNILGMMVRTKADKEFTKLAGDVGDFLTKDLRWEVRLVVNMILVDSWLQIEIRSSS
jgi:hypothetical protein